VFAEKKETTMADGDVIELAETISPGHRLGRHVEHDARSRNFPAAVAPIADVKHVRHGQPFDQGQLGSCTGNAMAGAMMTEPYYKADRILVEANAVLLYEQATHLDRVQGSYPPDDTGSTGLAVAKAAKRDGYISAYSHAFGLQQALGALTMAPVIAGINWYTSFDTPLPTGECPLTAGATIRGGHEIELFGLSVEDQQVWAYQSWGPTWGGLGNGTFWFSYATFEQLLAEKGDVTAFTV
jgi:hypothetical protein